MRLGATDVVGAEFLLSGCGLGSLVEQLEDEAGVGRTPAGETPQQRCRFRVEVLDETARSAEKTVMRIAWIRRTRAVFALPSSALTPAT